MPRSEDPHREGGAEESAEHVRLGIPDETLGTEESVGGLTEQDRRAPFEDLVGRAESPGEADARPGGQAYGAGRRPTEQPFADHQRRDDALHQVTETVVRIARLPQPLGHPCSGRHFGVGVMGPDDQDDRMEEHPAAEEDARRPVEPPGGAGDEEDRQDLEHPDHVVTGAPGGQEPQDGRKHGEPAELATGGLEVQIDHVPRSAGEWSWLAWSSPTKPEPSALKLSLRPRRTLSAARLTSVELRNASLTP